MSVVRIRALVLLAVLSAGCLGDSSGDGDPHLGVSAAFPAAWSVTWRPCADCADPRGVFLAASYRTTAAQRRQGLMCGPVPAGRVVISLDEVLPDQLGDQAPHRSDYPPRPAAFRVAGLRLSQVREGCNQPRARLFRFRDSGRLLYAWTVFWPHVTPAVRARAEGVLNSLRVAPLR
jgi:hypothetical protein